MSPSRYASYSAKTPRTASSSSERSFAGDSFGILSLIKSVLNVYVTPYKCGDKRLTGWMSALIVIVVAITLQVTLLDLLLLPWLSGVMRDAEDRGSTFGWLDELLNRTEAA